MRTFAIIALFALISFCSAETLTSARLRGANKNMEHEDVFLQLKKTNFGQNLFNMLSLKFKASKGRLDEIIQLLDKLDNQIHEQGETDKTNFEARQTDLTQRIASAEQNITNHQELLKKQEAQQEKNRADLDDAKAQLADRTARKNQITEFLANLKEMREEEIAQFNQRVEDQKVMIAGIAKVKEIFHDLTKNAEVNQDSLQEINNQLDAIAEAVTASIEDDKASEEKASASYKRTVDEQTARLAELKVQIRHFESEITRLEAAIEELTKQIAHTNKVIEVEQALLKDLNQQLDALRTQYKANRQVRAEQRETIKKVKARLQENPENVQQYLNNAWVAFKIWTQSKKIRFNLLASHR